MRSSFLCLGFTLSLLSTSTVLAEPKAGVKTSDRTDQEIAARKACMVGNVEKGVDILADLFLTSGEAVYIFNQGRCFQQNHQWQKAIDRFSEFLRTAKDASAEARAEAHAHIAECETKLPSAQASSTDSVSPPPPTPEPVPPSRTEPVTPTITEDPTGVTAAPTTTVDRGFGLRMSGIIVGTLGLAGIGSGIYCSVKTYDVRDDKKQLDRYKAIGNVSYGVGAAALATGIVLYAIGHSRKDAPPTGGVALIPTVAPGHTALLLHGTF